MGQQAGPWWQLVSRGPDDTRAIGVTVGELAEAGDVVWLVGPLGSGKTTLVKGIAQGLGLDEQEVVSPTFLYVREVPGGRLPLFHVDGYRLLGRPAELVQALAEELGLDYYLQQEGLVVIEWPEALAGFGELARRERLEAHLLQPGQANSTHRQVCLRGAGRRGQWLAEQVAGRHGGRRQERCG